ncbi:hypothetical protein D3C80_1534090 [compost metagenome]
MQNIIILFFKACYRNPFTVCVTQDMSRKGILRIITLLFFKEGDPGRSKLRLVIILYLIRKGSNLILQLLIYLPSFISNLNLIKIFSLFVLGMEENFNLTFRFVQQLTQTLDNFVLQPVFQNHLWVDGHCISGRVNGQSVSVPVGNLTACSRNYLISGP